MSTAKNVTSRLTDPKGFTGSHKERFDESGKGKGLAGRKDVINYDGNTNAAARNTVDTRPTDTSRESLKSTSKTNLAGGKFGVQAAKPVCIFLHRNGDKHHQGEKVLIKNFRSIEQVCQHATENVKLTTGPVKKIYKDDLKTLVKSLEEFEDGKRYLCCSGEGPNKERLHSSFFQ